MSPVKLSCAAGATLAFSRHTNRAVVVIRQDSVPGAGVLTSWKQCNTGGYTRSPGLSARLSPPGCCHIYHTHWRWQGKAVTITLAWLPLPFCSPTPNTHRHTQTHTHTHTFPLPPPFPRSLPPPPPPLPLQLKKHISNEDMPCHMHHVLTLMLYVEIW